jgi:hypothetical protein
MLKKGERAIEKAFLKIKNPLKWSDTSWSSFFNYDFTTL